MHSRLLTLAEAAKLPWLPRRRAGKKPAMQTLWRWQKHGCSGIRLRVTVVGSTICTKEIWLREFFDALAEAREVREVEE